MLTAEGAASISVGVVEQSTVLIGPARQLAKCAGDGDRQHIHELAASAPTTIAHLPVAPERAELIVRNALGPDGGTHASDSVLALAGLIAAARSLVADGNVTIGYRNGLTWTPIEVGEPFEPVREAAAELAKHAQAESVTSAIDVVQRLAVTIASAYASTLALPRALSGKDFPASLATEVRFWAKRCEARAICNGARLVLILDPPDGAVHSWYLYLAIVEPATDEIHQLYKGAEIRLSGVGDRATQYLIDVEMIAARQVSKTPKLMTQYGVVLDNRGLLKFFETIEAFEAAGIEVRTPKGMNRKARMRTKISVSGSTGGMVTKDLGLKITADLDGKELSDEDLRILAEASAPFVQLGSDWVRVPPDAKAAARLIARVEAGPVSASDLLDEEFDQFDIEAVDVSGWVGAALRGEAVLSAIDPVSAPAGLQADLRHYQVDGLAWLTWCEANNVGGILADDMGLGKTIQLLSRILADHPGPTLVVCPTSLMDNWLREAAKFTPSLTAGVYHGTARDLDAVKDFDIVLTTYALLAKDAALQGISWHRVILDEAQAIKNPTSKAAQAARKLTAAHRFAVTGTPVENHLGDLWSLSAFATPGLLGSFAKFRRRYLGVDAALDTSRLERLRAVVSPFLLRRTKRDKSVVPDLPDKVELRRDCLLTREQAGLYEAIVKKLEDETEDADGLARRGLILAGLTKLKQACVHPQLARGTHEQGLTASSGKLDELIEIVNGAVDEGDALIVFSQYATFLRPLADFLTEQTGHRSVRIDGSMTRAARTRSVDEFSSPDGPPLLLASLKAGGTGLNLVRASHVVHLDRWWNPAVEDQGSDRAWRIGQTQTVFVHTLVCPGTLEERIADVLSGKRVTAAAIASPESSPAVTELSNADLRELVTLVRDEQTMLRSS